MEYKGGELRVSFTDTNNDGSIDPNTTTSNELLQTQSYYPFGLVHSGIGNVQVGSPNLYQLTGKELQSEIGWSDFGARMYDASIGRWGVIDPLSQGYVDKSPYGFTANNPIRNYEVDGKVYDDRSEKRARKMKKRLNKKIKKQLKKVNKAMKKNNNTAVTEAQSRIIEMQQSLDDIEDMRNSTTEFRFRKSKDSSNPSTDPNGDGLPVTVKTAQNQITMYMDSFKNFHEPRHGGQIARGEFNIPTVGGEPDSSYGASHEVSAYKAEYSYRGYIKYTPYLNTNNSVVALQLATQGVESFKVTINSFNQISKNLLELFYDRQGVNQQPIYLNRPTNWWKK